jgi:ABC-type cobalamin/Fe3+-siderophores transport systems, ATPase components
MKLEIKQLKYAYSTDCFVVDGVDLSIKKGEFVGLIGPNGCGKSTVLKNVYRVLKPSSGSIFIDNDNIEKLSYRNTAQKISVVGQNQETTFDFTVREVVSMGRHPYKKLFEADTKKEKELILKCLESLGMQDRINEKFSTLSGGEKQRVLLAKAVAQDTDFMILDEPTNHLDINYQIQIFDLLKNLNITVFTAIHDLNIAALYCDRLLVINKGKIVFEGTPEEVVSQKMIKEIYHVDAHVYQDKITKKVRVSYIPQYLKEEFK